ncbi:MAG: aminotransferase class V-fold PLP-dependent enzyme [Ruminococcaceae bacterium]|nr:aminotransferase class V-fold PLP-dependent enzyme [Oscillospiraceae bacterium]
MNTPICDFVARYCEKAPLRLHMPGHKGVPLLGFEARDITEIVGADSLYEASGIILESERNATSLFGSAHTFYSTEGSSLCIRAMLAMITRYAAEQGRPPVILAARNVHKTFVTAAGLLDVDVEWLCPHADANLLSAPLDLTEIETRIEKIKPIALYLTAPDYLGALPDLAPIAKICHRHAVLLLVDNAHGAYLKFLPTSRHPLDLGADLVCDSAHKTLPALTGAAYLHVSKNAPTALLAFARDAMACFGSTSPSYLILQSLDALNVYLIGGYTQRLASALSRFSAARDTLTDHGYLLFGNEPLKWTVLTKPYGYDGFEFADLLAKKGITCEFFDPDHTVFMLSPDFGDGDCDRLVDALCEIPRRAPIASCPPRAHLPERACPIRQAMLGARERIETDRAEGRVLASLQVSCPPAVPILVCGEVIDADAIEMFRYYGIRFCEVLRTLV